MNDQHDPSVPTYAALHLWAGDAQVIKEKADAKRAA